MTDRLVKVIENGRHVLRGLSKRRAGPLLEISDDEKLTVTVDWSGWLGSNTISSIANTAQSVTLSGATNTTTQATFDITATASGWVEHVMTASDGQKKRIDILVSHEEPVDRFDYRECW